MNGATEATLQELLIIANRMNINLEKFVSQLNSTSSGGGSSSSGLSGLASVAKFATPAGAALGILQGAASLVGSAFSMLGNILGKVVTGFTKTAGNLFDFAKSAMDGTASLSSLADAFKDLPFFIGDIAHGFSQIIKYSEGLLDTYRQLTKSGASFSGDLFEMRIQASRTGLTFAEFSNIISANGGLFSTMGLNVQTGVNKFVLASEALLGPKSELSKGIFGLGVTANEAAGFLVSVIAQQGVMGKKNALTAEELAQKTHDYIFELDALSKLTGIEKETLDKKLKDLANDQQYQLFRDRLAPAGQAMLDSLQKIGAAMGPGAEDAIKFGAQGMIAPMTKAGEAFNITSGGMYADIATMARKLVKEGGYTTEQATKIIMDKFQIASGRIVQFSDGMADVGSLANAEMLNAVGPIIQFGRTAKDNNKTMYEALLDARKLQELQKNSLAAQLGQAQQDIRNFGNTLSGFLATMLKPMAGILGSWGGDLAKWGSTNIEKLQAPVERFVKFFKDWIQPKLEYLYSWFNETLTKLGTTKGWEETWTVLKDQFKKIWTEMIEPMWQNEIKPALKQMWIDIRPTLVELFTDLTKAITEGITTSIWEKMPFTDTAKDKRSKYDEKNASVGKGETDKEYQAFKTKRLQEEQDAAMQAAMLGGMHFGISETDIFEEWKRQNAKKPEGKASGGPASAGTYLVGEKGPELISTGAGSNIITNENVSDMLDKLGESGTVNNNLLLAVQMLNKQTAQMLASMQETADYSRRNNDALRAMTGNAFA